MKINETKLVTRYAETDQMGIIYHSNYFIYFEVGRTDLLKNRGMKYEEMEAMDIMLPVIEVGCKYKSPAKYADEIIVQTKIDKLTPTRIRFDYRIFRKEDEALLVEGFTEHAFVSKESGKPMSLKKVHREIYDQLKELV